MAYLADIDFNDYFDDKRVDIEGFVKQCENNFFLFREVANQMDYSLNSEEDLAEFMRTLHDIYHSEYGMAGGFNGFINYRETSEFFNDNFDEILYYHKKLADEFDKSFDEYINNFARRGDYTINMLHNPEFNNLKNDLVWGYIEHCTSVLMNRDIDEFEEYLKDKITLEDLKEAIECFDNEMVLDFINHNDHEDFTANDFKELLECAKSVKNNEITEAIIDSKLAEETNTNKARNRY